MTALDARKLSDVDLNSNIQVYLNKPTLTVEERTALYTLMAEYVRREEISRRSQ